MLKQRIDLVKDAPRLIPRADLFADPNRWMPKRSPNGKYLSFLAPFNGELNLWLAPIDALDEAKPLTQSTTPLQNHDWAPSGDYLLYIHDNQGDENWQLYAYELATQKNICYTPSGTKAKILQMSALWPDKILIGLNSRVACYYDAYELNLKTGKYECCYENNKYWDIFADETYRIQIGIQIRAQDAIYVDLASLETPTTLVHVSHEDLLELYFYPRLKLGLSKDNASLFLAKTCDQNTSELIEVDRATKEIRYLGHDKQADIFDVLLDPQTKRPLAFATYYQCKIWHGLSEEIMEDFAYLRQLDNGDIGILSQCSHNQEWIVSFNRDDAPMQFYRYSRRQRCALPLFSSFEPCQNIFVKMHPKVLSMQDGIECVSYLSLPLEIDPTQSGNANRPIPLVLVVHGGPSYRDFSGFNAIHQWLANRGYAVLSVNYRGSTGFGSAHVKAGYGEWAGKIHQDLLEAVQWAIREGITTQGQVAIMGRSFGGYETLVGLTMTPEVFCCGIDLVGPANLETMLAHLPPHWKLMQTLINEMIGCDPTTLEGKAYLAKRSPLFYANAIQKPLLIGHGANDAKIMQSESDQMVDAMLKNNVPVTYVVFPDEGHQIAHPKNRMAFYEMVEAFLAKNLQGRCEPRQPKLESSMVVIVDDFNLV